MEIQLNGSAHVCPAGQTVEALLQSLALADQLVAVEKNGEIVTRSSYSQVELLSGDRVEVVRAIGGG